MSEQNIDDKMLDEATEWFVLMRADDISKARSKEFVRWISQSSAHQEAYAEIGGFWDGLSVLEAGDISQKSKMTTNVTSLGEHKTRKKKENIPEKSRWSPKLMVASLAFLALSIIGYEYSDVILMESHTTKIGAMADVILEDGSHLALNTNSKIRVDLQNDRRVVYLERGEVYFDVSKDKNRPFFVETKGGLVRVLGTKFNIRQRGNTSDVTVVEGAVGVIDYGKMSDGITDDLRAVSLDATLTPNQKFSLGNDALGNIASPVDSRAALSWRDRKLIYNGESFAALIADINRYYEVEIRIGDPALNNIEVVAILKIEDRAATLKALETTFHVTAQTLSKDLIMLYPNKL